MISASSLRVYSWVSLFEYRDDICLSPGCGDGTLVVRRLEDQG